jgi:transposase
VPFGGSYLLDGVWRRLGIDRTLSKLLQDREYQVDMERLVFAMVANRALEPRSKLGLEKWVGRKTHIEGLEQVTSQNLYRAMDFLVEHDEEVQRRVYFGVATLLNLEVDLLFFDTTSTYFEVEEEDEDGLRRFGHSKDHRADRPQIVIGLAVTRGGLPVRCWVVPGNTNDASMVDQVQRDLAGWRLNRVIWVMDRGMAGEEQRVALQRGGGHVIMGERLRGAEALNHAALDRAGRYKVVRDNLEVKEVRVQEGAAERRFVVVRNPREAERDRKRRERLVSRLEEELKQVNKSLKRRNGKHTKAACALKTHPTYGRYLRELKSGQLRLDRAALTQESRLDGKYLLSTTDPGLSAEDVALGYKQLIDVEWAFRTMKSTLDLKPLYHRLDDRIRSHVLLCWLGLLLVRVIETETGASWEHLRDEMTEIHVV